MKANEKDDVSHPKVDSIASGAHEAVDWAADATNYATDSLSGKSRQMNNLQKKWRASGRGYVRENPATSVGIAFVGGYLLSRILRAR
ncbi:hypothetical protein [Wenzhouxiangella sp. EGI_FJ10409]|uniref:hypothetical protein n=1 Tax=Wenzhouxiangella sp. EGI_FJ10409 TaxID=3243767 RepID=UPI0035D89BB9